jgi:hypothetical protein
MKLAKRMGPVVGQFNGLASVSCHSATVPTSISDTKRNKYAALTKVRFPREEALLHIWTILKARPKEGVRNPPQDQ